MTSKKPWRVLHTQIDGSSVDRETAHPSLSLELHPLGTQFEPDAQRVELHLQVGTSRTVLDQRGIEALIEFLSMRP